METTEDRNENDEGRHPNLVEVETPHRRKRCLVLALVVVLCFIVIGGGVSVPFLLSSMKQSGEDRTNRTTSQPTTDSPVRTTSGFNSTTQPRATSTSTDEGKTTNPTTSQPTNFLSAFEEMSETETVTSYSWSEWSPWSPCNSTICAVESSTRERVCKRRRGAAPLSRHGCDNGVSSQETRTCPLMSYCTDCQGIHSTIKRADNGTYLIDPDGKGPFKVYCDMKTDGEGWTVFQRRQDGSEDFNRTWDEYKTGFGNLSGEFWLGNEYIHRLTYKRNQIMRVDMGEKVSYYHYYAIYDNFSIGSERENYILHVGYYREGHTDSLLWYENGKMFSTFDRDNDGHSDNLAASIGGGWWYPSWYWYNERSPNGLYKSKFGWYHSSFNDITQCDFKIK